MEILRSRLLAQKQKRAAGCHQCRPGRGQVGTGDRSERIRTYNFPQDRVHRPPHRPYRPQSG